MSVEVNDESGADVDAERLAQLSRFVLDRLRVHPLAELSIIADDAGYTYDATPPATPTEEGER